MSLVVLSAVFFSIGTLPVTVGFSLSKQLLGRDFSFRHDGKGDGCKKSEKGRKGKDRKPGDPIKKEEGGRRRRRGRGSIALQVPACWILQDKNEAVV